MKRYLFLFSLVASSVMAQNINNQPAVDVVGEGSISVVPDQVVISVEVATIGNDVQKVKSDNDASVNKVLQFLKSSSLDKKDYQTQYVNLRKDYDYQNKKSNYSATQSIQIKLKDLSKYEELMQGLLNSGVNRINSVNFGLSNPEKYQSEARKKAIENAKMKAQEYAAALGQNIGKAIRISESRYQSEPYPMYQEGMVLTGASSNAGAPSTLMEGTMQISSDISVSFELQ